MDYITLVCEIGLGLLIVYFVIQDFLGRDRSNGEKLQETND